MHKPFIGIANHLDRDDAMQFSPAGSWPPEGGTASTAAASGTGFKHHRR